MLDWFQTYTGKQFYPFNPEVKKIDIIDIAHSLSLICRFNGHCKLFYSVAQHSVLVADKLPDELKIYGLLHDAPEAYTGDFIRPLKRSDEELEEIINYIQINIWIKILAAFNLKNLGHEEWKQIKEIDNRMLVTEKRDLFIPQHEWKEEDLYDPYKDVIVPWDSNRAEKAFLIEFQRLTNVKIGGY